MALHLKDAENDAINSRRKERERELKTKPFENTEHTPDQNRPEPISFQWQNER